MDVPRWKRLLLVIAVAVVGGGMDSSDVRAAQTPGPCVPLESQSWWQENGPAAFPGDSQHVHVGACFPHRVVVTGTYTLDVVVKMHNEQGRWLTQVRIDDDTDQTSQRRYSAPNPHLRCMAVDCTFTVPVTVPTDELATGAHEWRVAAATAPVDSNSDSVAERNLATSGWPVCIRSCTGTTPANNNTQYRGWYRTATPSGLQVVGYNVVRFGWTSAHDAEFPWIGGSYRPVSGVWRPPIQVQNGSTNGDQEPVIRSRCWVDPDFHHGSSGTQVLDASGPFQSRLSIDTTTLSNGVHALVCAAGSDEDGILDGVMRVPFSVNSLLPPLPPGLPLPPELPLSGPTPPAVTSPPPGVNLGISVEEKMNRCRKRQAPSRPGAAVHGFLRLGGDAASQPPAAAHGSLRPGGDVAKKKCNKKAR